MRPDASLHPAIRCLVGLLAEVALEQFLAEADQGQEQWTPIRDGLLQKERQEAPHGEPF